MTRSARRARPGLRRDSEIRSIRSDALRYPQDDPRVPEPLRTEEWCTRDRSSLSPTRDTGLAIRGRLAREARRRERERRQRAVIAVATLLAIALLVIGWRHTSDRKAASASADPVPPPATTIAAGASPMRAMPSWTRPRGTTGLPSIAAASLATRRPTPIIASLGALDIRLPVRLEDLTEIGFHQASYAYAMHMRIALPKANMAAAKKNKGTRRDLSKQAEGERAVLTGRALVMWRSRPGAPDSAADVGAKAGSDVLAPVSGVVVKIKRYKLYGKYDDLEIHIRPDDAERVDCVLIHVDDPSVSVGDRVVSGVTRIAAVRLLSNREKLQLADYTGEAGDHVHIQMNDIRHPDYKGLEGAIDPKSVPQVTRPSAFPAIVR